MRQMASNQCSCDPLCLLFLRASSEQNTVPKCNDMEKTSPAQEETRPGCADANGVPNGSWSALMSMSVLLYLFLYFVVSTFEKQTQSWPVDSPGVAKTGCGSILGGHDECFTAMVILKVIQSRRNSPVFVS